MFRRLFVAVKDGVKTALHALRVWAQQQPHTFKLILAVFAVGGVLAVVGFAPGVIAAGNVTYSGCLASHLMVINICGKGPQLPPGSAPSPRGYCLPSSRV